MKKLSKLEINTNKIIKQEDLTMISGGYGGGDNCQCDCYNWDIQYLGTLPSWVPAVDCNALCLIAYGSGFGNWNCS